MRTSFALVALAGLLLTSCSTTSSRTTRSEFEDIPVPGGLTYLDDRSTVIESPAVKAARLIYRGRIEVTSLGTAIRSTLEANGWRNVSVNRSGSQGSVQIYEKAGGNSLQVRLWEEWYYTYVELTATRLAASATK